jgi:peptidoglycan hydrolase-like protein with peptidoglycan-binding domain
MRFGRAVVAIAAGALLCLGPLTATEPATAAIPAARGCLADAELTVGDTGTDVICLQFALGVLDASTQPLTGVFDETTAAAVSWFQGTHPPLRVDGRAGPRTLEALGIWSGVTEGVSSAPAGGGAVFGGPCRADATIEPGEVSQSVSCMQEALRDVGLYNGLTNGVSDAATVEAVKAYQRDTPPLTVDGFAGPRTLAALGIWSGNAGAGTSTVVAPGGNGGFAPPGPWPAPIQLEPQWGLTPDGLPVYGNRNPCSRADADMIAYQFALDGADVATQQWAVYIATREGGCRFGAVNLNLATQDDSHCTYQLNALSGMFSPTGSLGRLGWTVDNVKASMANCANAASDLWVFCGRGPWTPPYSCRPPWKDAGTPGIPAVPIIPDDGDA